MMDLIKYARGASVLAVALALGAMPVESRAAETPARRDSLKTYTLEELEAVVLEKNLSLQAQRFDLLQAQSDVKTASLRPNPSLNLNGDLFPIPGERFSPTQKIYGFNLQMPLERGGKRRYRIETAQDGVLNAGLQFSNGVRQALLSLRLAYYDALATQEALKMADDNLVSYQKLVSLNESRFRAGQISAAELSRSILAQSQAELQREDAALGVKKAGEALVQAIGWREEVVLRDTLAVEDRAVEPLPRLQEMALMRRPDVLAARSTRQAAEANIRLQDAVAAVDVGVSLDYSQQQGANFYGLSTQVPLPVFNRNQGDREKARLRLRQAERQIELSELTVVTEVRSAYAEYETRKAALDRFLARGPDGILTRAKSIKTAAEFAYKNGSTSLLELLDAVRTYNDVYKSYVDAVASYNKSLAVLDAATGADHQTLGFLTK